MKYSKNLWSYIINSELKIGMSDKHHGTPNTPNLREVITIL